MDHDAAAEPVAEAESCCSDLDDADDASPECSLLAPAEIDHCCHTELSSLPTPDTFAPASGGLPHCGDAAHGLGTVSRPAELRSVEVRRTVSDSSPPGIRDLSISNSILRI